jgi:hypothetical protein
MFGKSTRKVGLPATLAALALATAAVPAGAATPQGSYAGMGDCPLSSSAMTNASNPQVGCVYSVTNGGSVTIGSITVALTAPIILQFGTYWPAAQPVVSFPDGSSANVYSTVAPADGKELVASPLQVPIPGIANIIPGVTSVYAQVEIAGPITDFVPLATGETYPVFHLPIKLHLINALLGLSCYVGSNSHPIMLEPIATDPGTIGVDADPNGYSSIVASFTGATLTDSTVSVPGASGCGLLGTLDGLVDLAFGVPSAAGGNTVTFSPNNTSFALDSTAADLRSAIAASST